MELIRGKEMRKILGVSAATLCRWRECRGMPSYKIGRTVFYPVDQVFAWIRAHEC